MFLPKNIKIKIYCLSNKKLGGDLGEIKFLFTNLYQIQRHLIQRHVKKTLAASLTLLRKSQNFQTFLSLGGFVAQ